MKLELLLGFETISLSSVFQCLAPEDFEPEAAYESDLGLDDDDSDSNAEDNWRNDYPDEETDFERRELHSIMVLFFLP